MGFNIAEIVCTECGDEVQIRLDDEEYEYYLLTDSLIEGSDAYHELFDGHGWVLRQMPFCDICKYDHSEIYRDD